MEPKLFWDLEPEPKIILINISCIQFGGCLNEEKVIATSITGIIVLVF